MRSPKKKNCSGWKPCPGGSRCHQESLLRWGADQNQCALGINIWRRWSMRSINPKMEMVSMNFFGNELGSPSDLGVKPRNMRGPAMWIWQKNGGFCHNVCLWITGKMMIRPWIIGMFDCTIDWAGLVSTGCIWFDIDWWGFDAGMGMNQYVWIARIR